MRCGASWTGRGLAWCVHIETFRTYVFFVCLWVWACRTVVFIAQVSSPQ